MFFRVASVKITGLDRRRNALALARADGLRKFGSLDRNQPSRFCPDAGDYQHCCPSPSSTSSPRVERVLRMRSHLRWPSP